MAPAKPKISSGRGRGRPRKNGQAHVFKSVKPVKHNSLRSGREYAQKPGSNELKVGVALNGDAPNRGRGRPRKSVDVNDEAEQDTSSITAATINHNVAKDDKLLGKEAIPSPSLPATTKRGRGRPRKSLNVQFLSSQEEGTTQTPQHPATAPVDEESKDEEAKGAISPTTGSKRKRGRPKKLNNVNMDGNQSNEISTSNIALEGAESGSNQMSPSNFTAINGVNLHFDASAEVQGDEESDDFGNQADGQGASAHRIVDTGRGRLAHETHCDSVDKLAPSPSLDPSFPTKRGRGRPPKKAKTSVDVVGSLSAVSSNGAKSLSQLTNSSDEDSYQHALKGSLTRALTGIPRQISQYGMSPAKNLAGRIGPDISNENEVQQKPPKKRVKTFLDGLKTANASNSPLENTEDHLDRPNDAFVMGQSLKVSPESQTSNASEWVYKAPTALMLPDGLSNTTAAQLPQLSPMHNNHTPNGNSGHISDPVQSQPSVPEQVYPPLHSEHNSSHPIAPATPFEEVHEVALTAVTDSMAPSPTVASKPRRAEGPSADIINELVAAGFPKRDTILKAAERLTRATE